MKNKKAIIILFAAYIAVVFFMTLVPIKNSVHFEVDYNLTLFKSIENYIRHMKNFGLINREALKYYPGNMQNFMNNIFTVSFKNIAGNILLFMPFGFFSAFFIKDKKFMSVVCYSAMLSTFIEIMQNIYFTSRRADIDDVILNVLGAVIGYIVYKIFTFKKLKWKRK